MSDRILAFACETLRVVRLLPRDLANRHISTQLVRCGTGVGANYEEARSAESRADFAHKAHVAAKEMRETIYWLRIVRRQSVSRQLTPSDLDNLLDEANQLAAILMASAKTARTQP